MDKKQRRRLKTILSGLDAGERNRLTRRAAKMRKAAMSTQKPGAKRPDLDEFLLELVEPEPGDDDLATTAAQARVGDERGAVTGIAAGACTVLLAGGLVQASLPEDLARRQQSDLAVGDQVLVERSGEAHRVSAVLPRRSLLSRADPLNPQRRRAIAANVDLVVIVVAAKAPPLHPRLIDRYLVAVEHSGADPVLVVNKTDLLSDEARHELLARLQPYRSLGLPVLPCSASAGEGVESVRAELSGRTCVFVGQSGVGKSSLLNALDPSAAVRTGAVRAGDGRGRQTTTGSALYDLPGDIKVIDTPGIRRFSLDGADQSAIATGFAEFAPFASGCRYRDCTHVHEPECAVRLAVREGAIPRSRYRSYRKLLGGDGDDPRTDDGEPAPAGGGSLGGRPSTGPAKAGGSGSRDAGGHFSCAHCGRPVPLEAIGSEHRNHCPFCLHSLHLDEEPGDRSACCGGVMEPVTVWVRRSGEWALVHRCRTCGRLSSNRIASDDNEVLLLSLAVKPLSAPPFPLDRLAGTPLDGRAAAQPLCVPVKERCEEPTRQRFGGPSPGCSE